MSAFYARLLATANRLISEYGQPATLVRPGAITGPAYDPSQGPDVLADCVLVDTEHSLTNRQNQASIEVGDRMGIIAVDGLAFVPALSDRLEIGGERYNFVDVQPLNPGGTVLLYEYHVRK